MISDLEISNVLSAETGGKKAQLEKWQRQTSVKLLEQNDVLSGHCEFLVTATE